MVYDDMFQFPIAMFVVDDFGNDIDIYWLSCYDSALDFIQNDWE